MQEDTNVVKEYIDPMQKYKPIEKIHVKNEDINDRMTLKEQYQKQVFQPGHNLPTMSIEQLADEEMADAMERQRKEQIHDQERANEDPESEEILERERLRALEKDEFADYCPKGRGNTQRM